MRRERRRSKRIPFTAKADIISSGRSFPGFIQDVSEEGVLYILSSVPEVSAEFVPDKHLGLVLKDPSGKECRMECELKWYTRGKGSDRSMTFGMMVNDPPPNYKELIDSLKEEKQADRSG